ncbi:MAG: DUF342 domain-containing protein [Oscillibacter sp.]|nr:DUF342 domain-containing protein [Oscillibacter sp.]
MSLREKIASFLFRARAKENLEDGAQQEQAKAETAEAQEDSSVNPAVLELSPEHALHRLREMRRQEAGYMPAPRICLDEEGILPPELVKKELNRLRSFLSSACGARLKQAKGKKPGKNRKKEKEAGEPEDEGDALMLDALPQFFLSADKLYAWMIVLPPVGEGQELNRDLLWRAMRGQGITYGVDERLVDRLSHDDERYFHLYLIAKGKPAFDGKNGNIVDYFPRVVERVMEVDEFGQVDYANLNLIRNVKEGQEICRLIKPTEGEPGRTVTDQEIPAKSGKPVPLPKGRNTEISEDELSLIAVMPGHVEFTGRSFQVKPVLDIDGNVDFSTGNIKFLGDINIKGDVLSGFTVRAMGDIHVGGVVEAGSTVEAGGDLVVVKGILGDGTTVIRAHRCVFSKYIENSTIYVRENLQTDCIINGRVYCDGEVHVRSGRGSIMGGRIWAAKLVNAASVGSPAECRTTIALGGLPCTNFEREVVQQELKDLEMDLEKLECQPDSPVKSSLLAKLRVKLSTAELKLKQLEDDLVDIEQEMTEKTAGRMECGVAYPETEISIGDEMLRLRRETRQCVAKLVSGEIVVI